MEEQYPVEGGYIISEHKDFKFEDNEAEPCTSLKITAPEDERYYTIGMDPLPAEVSNIVYACG